MLSEHFYRFCRKFSFEAIYPRSYWIPGSWNLRMVYTDAIPFYDP